MDAIGHGWPLFFQHGRQATRMDTPSGFYRLHISALIMEGDKQCHGTDHTAADRSRHGTTVKEGETWLRPLTSELQTDHAKTT